MFNQYLPINFQHKINKNNFIELYINSVFRIIYWADYNNFFLWLLDSIMNKSFSHDQDHHLTASIRFFFFFYLSCTTLIFSHCDSCGEFVAYYQVSGEFVDIKGFDKITPYNVFIYVTCLVSDSRNAESLELMIEQEHDY